MCWGGASFLRPATWRMKMKTIASAVLAAGLLIGCVAEADAAVCARGAYHAGCAGPRGAVVTHGGYATPYHHGARCVWRYGRRVCY